jgi:hypothetical protein
MTKRFLHRLRRRLSLVHRDRACFRWRRRRRRGAPAGHSYPTGSGSKSLHQLQLSRRSSADAIARACSAAAFATILSFMNCYENNLSGICYKRDLYCQRRRLGIAVHQPAAPIGILLSEQDHQTEYTPR